MPNLIKSPIFQQLAYSTEALSLGTWTSDKLHDPDSRRLNGVLYGLNGSSPKKIDTILNVCQKLRYEQAYPETVFTDVKEQELFALAMSQAWLLAELFFEGKNAGIISALALLLPMGRELNFFEIKFSGMGTPFSKIETTKSSPIIQTAERFHLFPELLKLEHLSLPTRRLFIQLGINQGPTTELVISDKLSKDTRQEYIDALVASGLVSTGILGPNLRMFTLDEIKAIAESLKIKSIPEQKGDIVAVMINQFKPGYLRKKIIEWKRNRIVNKTSGNWLLEMKAFEQQVDLLIKQTPKYYVHNQAENFKGLRIFLKNEYSRLETYLFKVVSEISEAKVSIKMIEDQWGTIYRSDDRARVIKYNNYKKADNKFVLFNKEELTPNERKTVAKFWTLECDQILEQQIIEHPTKYPLGTALVSISRNFLQRGVLDSYRKVTARKSDTDYWKALLFKYITNILAKDKYYKLSSRRLICPACGVKFLEWSIPLKYALKVRMNVVFCSKCYDNIFNLAEFGNTTQLASLNDQELLNRLYQLGEAIQTLPLKDLVKFPELPAKPSERQIVVGKAFLQMPAYDIYIEKFGNWLTALVKSGLLNDGHQRTVRGIQCLASDGHFCLSLGEKVIDDWLTSKDIQHEKEVRYPFDKDYNANWLSRTDWKVGDIYIEYAGLMSDTNYASKMDRKTKLSVSLGFQLIIIKPQDLDHLEDHLQILLTKQP